MRLRPFAAASACFALLGSCGQASRTPQVSPAPKAVVSQTLPRAPSPSSPAPEVALPQIPVILSTDPKEVSIGDQDFAVRLYGQLRSQPGNLIFSPASIRLGLAMAYAGAAGQTQKQMASVLALGPEPHSEFASVLKDWKSREKLHAEGRTLTLQVVNQLWGEESINYRPEFLNVLDSQYGAPLKKVDFINAPEPNRLFMNQWVEQKTSGRIRNLLTPQSITSDTRLVLTNAIYFKAMWEHRFSPSQTTPEDFFVRPRVAVQVPMMHQTEEHFSYAAVSLGGVPATALFLHYRAPDLAMLVLMPEAKDGLARLEGALSASALIESVWGKLEYKKLDLTMPKFKSTRSFELKKQLSAMGMPLAFDPDQADFSATGSTRDALLDNVIHKAFIAVHEEGTEAAATTSIPKYRDGAIEETILVRLDHPFIYMIVDTRNASVLFMGRLANPSAN